MKYIYALILFVISSTSKAQIAKGENNYATIDFANLPEQTIKKTEVANSVISTTFVLPTKKLNFDNATPFISFSCRWEEQGLLPDNSIISVRFSKDNIVWTKWDKMEKDEHNIDGSNNNYSQLMYMDKAIKYYQIQAETGLANKQKKIQSLFLNFFNPGKINGLVSKENEVAARNLEPEDIATCPCPLPTYVTRTQWNCPQGQGLAAGVGVAGSLTHIVVHHSDGPNTATDWNAVVLSIWNYHRFTNGWSDIGYNWLVAPDGTLYEGRGSSSLASFTTGAHFCGFNTGTMGVCMIGNYMTTNVTAAARNALVNIAAWRCCNVNIDPTLSAFHPASNATLNNISGHQNGCATSCPGTILYNSLPTLRTEVQTKITSCNAVAPCVASVINSIAGCPSNNVTFTPTNVTNGGTAPTFAWYKNNVFVQTSAIYNLNPAVNGDKVFCRMTTNASCATATQVNSDTITISCIVPPPACTASVTNSITGCPSNNVTFTPTSVTNGGTAPTYAWYKNNVFVQTSAIYNLNPAVNGDKVYCRMTSNAACATIAQVNSDTITISCIVPPPACTASVTNSITGCPSSNVTFTPTNVTNGGTAPTYAWYKNNVLVQTSATYNLNPAVNGDKVYCRMTTNASCATIAQVNSDTITISCIVPPVVIPAEFIQVSPNPSNGNFVVKMQLNQSKMVSYKLTSADGKRIFATNKEAVNGLVVKPFYKRELAGGIYFLEINMDGTKTIHRIFISK